MAFKAIIGALNNRVVNSRLRPLWENSIAVTVTGADLGSAGTGTITIQAVDVNGVSVAKRVVVRTWIGTANDYAADALTDYSVTTGVQREEVLANAEYIAVTDATGKIVMAVDAGGADSVWAWAESAGNVAESGEVVLTA
jgi:hypothetical protein